MHAQKEGLHIIVAYPLPEDAPPSWAEYKIFERAMDIGLQLLN